MAPRELEGLSNSLQELRDCAQQNAEDVRQLTASMEKLRALLADLNAASQQLLVTVREHQMDTLHGRQLSPSERIAQEVFDALGRDGEGYLLQ